MNPQRLSEQIHYYDERWRQFSYANLYGQERCIFILNALLETQLENPRICDLGCGAGWLTNVLSAFGPTVGVELSPEAVRIASERYPGAQFICADATRWEGPENFFDVVVSQEVIEHIEDKRAYLSVAWRCLRPGGYLVMTTPNLRVLRAISTEARNRVWEIQPVELPVTRQELTAALAAAGFQVIARSSAVDGVGSLGVHRLVNSAKVRSALSACHLHRVWKRFLLNHDFGMYLMTVARRS